MNSGAPKTGSITRGSQEFIFVHFVRKLFVGKYLHFNKGKGCFFLPFQIMYALHDELHSHSITIIFTLYEPQILKAIEEVTTLSYQNHPAFRFTYV